MSKKAENTIKRAYLVKMAGSMGSIFDFSNVHVYSEAEIRSKCELFGASSYRIEYAHYDERIHFHKWHVLDENGGHLLWILSPTNKTPILSEWDVMEEGM